MKDYNEDPIKEYKTFRPGLDDLTGNDDINSDFDMGSFIASKGHHECSDDLSDRGSRLEEIAHAKYAEYKRTQNKYNNYNTYNRNHTNKVILDAKGKWLVYFFIFMFIVMPILQVVLGTVITIFSAFGNEYDNNEYTSNYDYEYQYEQSNEHFQTLKNNIKIECTKLGEDEVVVKATNGNAEVVSNISIEVIFSDGENRPLKVSKYTIDNLQANGFSYHNLYDIPSEYETYSAVITQPYSYNTNQFVDYENIDIELISDEDYYLNFEVENNTADDIDVLEFGILFYKADKIVEFRTERIYDLKSGKAEEERSYKFLENDEYDRVEYFVNDIYLYN